MNDEQIEIRPLHFTRRTVLTVDTWPERTTVTEDWLKQAHQYGATVEGDEVRFAIGNGESVYRLRRDLPRRGKGIVAELVEGNDATSLKRRRAKYETGGE